MLVPTQWAHSKDRVALVCQPNFNHQQETKTKFMDYKGSGLKYTPSLRQDGKEPIKITWDVFPRRPPPLAKHDYPVKILFRICLA